MMKAKHGKKLRDLLKVLTLMGLVTAAFVITPMAPAVAWGDGASIAVKAGYPTSIPADGQSTTVLVITIDSSSPCFIEAERAYIAGGEGGLAGTVSTNLGTVSPASLKFPPYEAEVTLVAGKQAGQATITVDVSLAGAVAVMGVSTAGPVCQASTQVTFEQAGASPGDVIRAQPKPPEPEIPKPRLTEEMVDDIAFVVNVGVSRGQEIQPEQLPHWDQLTPTQQEGLTEVLELLQLMGFLSQMLK